MKISTSRRVAPLGFAAALLLAPMAHAADKWFGGNFDMDALMERGSMQIGNISAGDYGEIWTENVGGGTSVVEFDLDTCGGLCDGDTMSVKGNFGLFDYMETSMNGYSNDGSLQVMNGGIIEQSMDIDFSGWTDETGGM